MSVRDIPATQWEDFLEDFTRSHRAWLATVERLRGGTPSRVVIHDRPLASVTTERQDQQVAAIAVQFQPDSPDTETVRVEKPARLRVDETGAGTARALEIDDGRGECTRIRFRAAPPPEALDGVTPGEV